MTDKPLRVLHFADAHIDMANYGRRDQESALPIRVMDFLSALDQIIDTAVDEAVDLVIFAIPLTGLFAAYLLLLRPAWFRSWVEDLYSN